MNRNALEIRRDMEDSVARGVAILGQIRNATEQMSSLSNNLKAKGPTDLDKEVEVAEAVLRNCSHVIPRIRVEIETILFQLEHLEAEGNHFLELLDEQLLLPKKSPKKKTR